ncbi:MAG: 3-ketoacyl-ACP reductase [Clostridia bacterium]|nr:3-ketoacyl-ACP reductase [Clostridia bacterium]MCR4577337.1 3-ketoacyl-ACP reductase [Clostridiales bacterium]
MRIALVTGSTRGIGRGIAEKLETESYRVVYSGTRPVPAAELPENAVYIGCNIADASQRENLFSEIMRRFGRLDVLVNNAGMAPRVRRDILETTEESFDEVLGVNLKGTFFMCQAAAKLMLELKQKGLQDYSPRIINIGSMSAYTSSTSRGEYCISKAGIGMVTLLFADRLAEAGIPVFEIRPGIINTDMTKVVHEKYENLIAGGLTPIKRFGQPKDVADMVAACCSGLLDFTTGQVLNADGGFHIRRL